MELEQKAVELLEKLDDLATQYAPEVIDAAMGAVKVTAIGNIIYGIAGVVAIIVVWWVTKKFASFCSEKEKKAGWMSDWEIGRALSLTFGGVTCVVFALTSLFHLFDIWNWVAIFNPKLALAHRLLGL